MANLRKYALETSPVADCENMHPAQIILSPYNHYPLRQPRARGAVPVAGGGAHRPDGAGPVLALAPLPALAVSVTISISRI